MTINTTIRRKVFLHRNWKCLAVSVGFADQKFPAIVRSGIWDHILNKAKSLYHSVNPWSWCCQSVSTCSRWPERKAGPEGPPQEGDFASLVSRATFPNSWAIWINWVTTKKCLTNIFKSLPKQIWNCCHSNNGLGWLSPYESFKYRF